MATESIERRNMARCHARARRTADAGSAFIEVLVSIVLLGVAGLAVLTGLAAAIRGADTHRDVADAQSWLASVGDALIEVPPLATDNYIPCDASLPDGGEAAIVSAYQTGIVDLLPFPHDVTIDGIEFWSSNFTPATTADDGFGPTCFVTNGDRLQEITLTSHQAGAPRTITVVKRPALDQTVNLGTPPTTLGGGNIVPEPTPGL